MVDQPGVSRNRECECSAIPDVPPTDQKLLQRRTESRSATGSFLFHCTLPSSGWQMLLRARGVLLFDVWCGRWPGPEERWRERGREQKAATGQSLQHYIPRLISRRIVFLLPVSSPYLPPEYEKILLTLYCWDALKKVTVAVICILSDTSTSASSWDALKKVTRQGDVPCRRVVGERLKLGCSEEG